MGESFRVACVQVNAGDEMAENLARAAKLIREAHAAGADFVATPENVSMMTSGRDNAFAKAAPEASHAALAAFRALSRELGIWLLVGSLSVRLEGGRDERGEDAPRLANRSFLLDRQGAIVGRYDKIHMFDVNLSSGQSYRESESFRPGAAAELVDTPWGPLGMTVCYDLRFAHLYRALAQAGARFLAIPSAFTRVTGEAHWHVLQRARAIETGSFVIAPAQCGSHVGGRQTFGHSLIVDPWGEVLADGGESPGVVIAEIEPARVRESRARVPALTHDRAFSGPEPALSEPKIRATA